MNSLGRYVPANFSASNPITIDAGLPWEYIRIINNSPYLLSVGFGNQGTFDFPEMYLEDISVGQNFQGKITIVPIANFSAVAINNALSSLISVTAYNPGEIATPQSQPLTTLANVGNTVQTGVSVGNINNVGETPPVNVIFDQPAGYSAHSILLIDTAELHLSPLGNATQADALAVVPGAGAGVFAVVKLDNGLIATDGQGNLGIAGNTLTFSHSLGGFNRQYIVINPLDGNKWALQENTADHSLTIIDATGSHTLIKFLAGGGIQFDAGLASTDGSGDFTIKTLSTTGITDTGTLAVTGTSSLDNAAITTDGSGNVTKANTITSTKALGGAGQPFFELHPSDQATFKFALELSSTGNLVIQDEQAAVATAIFASGGGGGLKLTGLGNFISAWSFFTGNATGTYSHGLGTTPNVVLLNASAIGSETLGWDSPTSTQVHITNGASVAWTALALKMV